MGIDFSQKSIGRYLRSHIAESLLYLDGHPFSLKDYPFFKAVYDTQVPEMLLKTGRQVSKSGHELSEILYSDGSIKQLKDVAVGDKIIALDDDGAHFTVGTVTWKSERYEKDCVAIYTRLGHELCVATTHPVRTWDGWTDAGKLIVSSRVATVRHAGEFSNRDLDILDDHIKFIAYMIGDGSCGGRQNGNSYQLAFHKYDNSPTHTDFLQLCQKQHWDTRFIYRKDKQGTRRAVAIVLSTDQKQAPAQLLSQWGIFGKRSADKFLPAFVWGLSKRQAALFLNRLWSTDGYVTKQKSRYTIGYSSISKQLAYGVQRLLHKFGIPSSLKHWQPKVYQGTDKQAYVVRIETLAGVRTFLTDVGVLGKEQNVPIPVLDGWENNNRDTFPKDINRDIKEIIQAAPGYKWGRFEANSLLNSGLRRTLKYAPTPDKLARYIDFFEKDARFPQIRVQKLKTHLTTHLYWDAVTAIKQLGKQYCYDISVSPGDSFVAEGIVTHNSTSCANLMITNSICRPHFKTLYVAPTKEQTSTFSNTRLTKIIQHSPHVRNLFVDNNATNNVLLIILRNGSESILSYACDDPDRVRGKTADCEFLDEIQDIQYDAVVPVVKECMSNSNYGHLIYAGTPKSMENTIEFLWQKSSQAEWILQCESCKKRQFVQTKRSLGKHGVICLHCGKLLNVRNGFWYDFNPKSRMKGFHVSQPIMPLNNEDPARWLRLLDKMETYSESKFNNEVLGISDARGSRLITLEELEALCEEYYVELPIQADTREDVRAIVGGVDWTGQGQDYKSRTVAWVFGLTTDFRLKTLYFKIFKGDNAIEDVNEVIQIFGDCGCQVIVGDAGGNPLANAMMRDRLGQHRVFQCQYGSYNGKLIRWNRKDRYLIDRTAAIDSYMLRLKRREVIFPALQQMSTPISDILNSYEEQTQPGSKTGGRRIWRHAATAPDDCLHAQVFCWLASKILQGEIELYERAS